MISLSVVINTKNSGKYLTSCLESVKALADEIVIVDMASTDDTLEIAERYHVKVFQYPDPEVGFADPAREFLFDKAQGEWLLMIDSDEEVRPKLAELIKKIIDGESEEFGGGDVYYIARRNIIFDRELTHTGWFPDYQPRLWKKGKLTWQPTVHSVPEIHGQVIHLPPQADLSFLHHNYKEVSDFIARTNKYTTFQAESENAVKMDEDFTATDFFNSYFDEWWRRLFAMEGYRDGNHGLVLSFLQAQAELQVKAKKWQMANFPHHQLSSKEMQVVFKQFSKSARYWLADQKIKENKGVTKLYWRLRRKLKV
ncbi:MAG: glycosyltransferase family 2 protein [Pseudomonadales bacterium]|jgi:(heptosyl)LPS beta-1,4-glucosyltransferase|nr:glycosyltransferase family 2 protein [Pseudomonadales bacterium]